MKEVKIRGDINPYSKNYLSILISQGGLSYSVYDGTDNKMQFLVSKDFENQNNKPEEIKSFITENELLEKSFAQINIIYATNKVTIVPDAIFDEASCESIYKLNRKLQKNEVIRYSKQPKSETAIIFAIETDILQTISEIFPNFNLYPQSHSFIETYLTKTKISENPNRQRVLVQVFENFFEILVIKNAQIINFNTYCYNSANDILYFIVNTFEQLGLSQTECEIAFSGFIDNDSMSIIYLKKFVKNVYFESLNGDYKYFYRFQDIAPHYFYNFLNINK
ncbi:MAG: DUF3822 family protein [Bacteroidales bacterium]|nr:DUF3822 family protein [Bacteroidales bacterium]